MTRFSPRGPSDSGTDAQPEPLEAVLLLDRDDEESTSSTETVAANRGAGLTGGLLLIAAVAVLFLLFTGDGSDGQTAPGDQAADGSDAALSELTFNESERQSATWPDPPIDHDPHVSGRPGSQLPVRETLTGQTVVYVNDRGRPTVIDLSTGDQREVDIAGPRTRDEFFVEQGKVVAVGGVNPDLPASQGRAFVFSVHRTAGPGDEPLDNEAMLPAMAGPSLCLDDGGCTEVPFVSGNFGGASEQATTVESPLGPIEMLADVLGAGWWARDGRWTVFALGATASIPEIRVPTPLGSSEVWVISQPLS